MNGRGLCWDTGHQKIVDDVVVFDKDEQQHLEHVREILRCCEERGISLNREKFKFCYPQAHFAGFMLTSEGYSISNDIIDAITYFPTPSSSCAAKIVSHGGR